MDLNLGTATTKKKRPSDDLAPRFEGSPMGAAAPSPSPAPYGGQESPQEESLEQAMPGPGEFTCPDCGSTYTMTKKEPVMDPMAGGMPPAESSHETME